MNEQPVTPIGRLLGGGAEVSCREFARDVSVHWWLADAKPEHHATASQPKWRKVEPPSGPGPPTWPPRAADSHSKAAS